MQLYKEKCPSIITLRHEGQMHSIFKCGCKKTTNAVMKLNHLRKGRQRLPAAVEHMLI